MTTLKEYQGFYAHIQLCDDEENLLYIIIDAKGDILKYKKYEDANHEFNKRVISYLI